MMLCEGNTQEYNELRYCSIDTYLLKLENYVEKLVDIAGKGKRKVNLAHDKNNPS